MNKKWILMAMVGAMATSMIVGCSDASSKSTAEEDNAFKTRKAEPPANFSTKPKDGNAFVGESKSIQIGGNAAPSAPPSGVGAGGTGGGAGAADSGANK
jgi:hypothetical protein